MSRWLLVCAVLAACGGNGKSGTSDAGGGDGSGTGDGGGPDANLACPNPDPAQLTIHAQQVIGSGLTQPLYLAQPAGSTDLYVVEKPGRIKIIRNGALLATPFLDITADVLIPNSGAEGGLLGLTFPADYAQSGRFFIYCSLKASGNKPDRVAIVEYHRSANPDVATPTPVAELLSDPQGGYNSLGGTILFGPDNYLWLAEGDAATMPSAAQDLTSKKGKILRVDVDNPGTPPPNGLGGNADPYVYDYGLRNPFRFSFDRQTHELWIADAGDTKYEEVNVEPPATGHRDYGWDRVEGMHCADGTTTCNMGTLPIYERAHETTYSVIVGGNVYRGSAIPCLRGRYIFGIFGSGHVLSFVKNGNASSSEYELTDKLNIPADITTVVGFSEDQAGELYVILLDGHIYKIVP